MGTLPRNMNVDAAKATLGGLFDRIDALIKKDGEASKKELEAVFGEHAGEFLKFCDKDADEKLTKDEFTAGILADCDGMSQEDFDAQWANRMEEVVAEAEAKQPSTTEAGPGSLVVAKFTLKEGKMQDWIDWTKTEQGLNITRNLEGCRALWTGVDAEDPNVWWATEVWDTPDAHKAYMAYRAENGLEELAGQFFDAFEIYYMPDTTDWPGDHTSGPTAAMCVAKFTLKEGKMQDWIDWTKTEQGLNITRNFEGCQ